MTDESESRILVGKAQAGDRAAFDTLAERYRGRLLSLLRKQLGKHLRARVDVEDLFQEVLLRSFRSLPQFQWTRADAFIRWISGIARHLVLEAARQEGRAASVPFDEQRDVGEDPPSSARVLRRAERFDRLKAAISGLKPDYREVIELARIRRLPMREVAERMDRTPRAASQLLLRALQELKHRFGDTESLGLPDRSLLDEGDDR